MPDVDVEDLEAEGPKMDPKYTWPEARGAMLVVATIISLVAVTMVALLLVDPGEDEFVPLEDVRRTGDFVLSGAYEEEQPPYGPYARALNFTMDVGDELTIEFVSTGPPGGVQVLICRPMPAVDRTVAPAGIEAGTTGTSGTLRLVAVEPGAYQAYFWHPGSARAEDDGGEEGGDPHSDAHVSYTLSVERSRRP